MSYPKPLSAKKIAQMYAEAGIDDTKKQTLQTLYQACVNLYGALTVQDILNVYVHSREWKKKTLNIGDIINYAAIARREVHPWYVYEINELFIEEEQDDMLRFIVHKDLLTSGWYRLFLVYELLDRKAESRFWYPDDIMKYAVRKYSKYEKELLNRLEEMESSEERLYRGMICECPNPDQGKKLKELHYLDLIYQHEAERLEKQGRQNWKEYQEIMRTKELPYAEVLWEDILQRLNTHWLSVEDNIGVLFRKLSECGVRITPEEQGELRFLITRIDKTSCMWYRNGR